MNDDKHIEIIDNNGENGGSRSSTGIDENIAGLLCYLATFITGIIFLLLEKKSQFVRFHAMQSTVFFIGIWIISYAANFIPLVGWMLQMVASILGFILWIVLMIKAYQKEYYKLPIVSDIAENFLKKMKPIK